MSFKKITSANLSGKGVTGLPDVPGLSATEMQQKFDELAKDVITPIFNQAIDELQSESAADDIGAAPPSGVTPSPKPAAGQPTKLSAVLTGIVNYIKSYGYAKSVAATKEELQNQSTEQTAATAAVKQDLTALKSSNTAAHTAMQAEISANTSARHTHTNKALLDTYAQTEADIKSAVDQKHSHANKALLDTYAQTEANIKSAVDQRHSHTNKALLDTYTQTEVNIKSAVDQKHSHVNKSVLDGITSANITAWQGAAGQSHTHANNTLLDTYAQTEANIKSAVDQRHNHSNKSVLDGITSAMVTAWQAAAAHISDAVAHITLAERNLWNTVSTKLPLTGGTLTGFLKLHAKPTEPNHAVNKSYVDDSISAAGGGDMLTTVYDPNKRAIVKKSEALFVEDTRKDNKPPVYYTDEKTGMGRRVISEMKEVRTVNFPYANESFITVLTFAPWGDAASLTTLPVQLGVSLSGLAFRTSKDVDTWNDWKKLEDKESATLAISAVKAIADAALPKTGGTISGQITYKTATATGVPMEIHNGDSAGSGVRIGMGGTTIIGGGESSYTAMAQITNKADEEMFVTNDSVVKIITNLQSGWSYGKIFEFSGSGQLLLPAAPTADGHAATKKYVDDTFDLAQPRTDSALATSAKTVAAAINEVKATADSAKTTAAAAQPKTDSALATSAKTVAAAINEVKTIADSAKAVANAALPKTGGSITGNLTVNGNASSGYLSVDNTLRLGGNIYFHLSASNYAITTDQTAGCINIVTYSNLNVINSSGAFKPVFASAFNVSSSRRYKKDIEALTQQQAEKLLLLSPVSFNYINGDVPAFGFIAEDVAQIDPLAVAFNADGEAEAIDYSKFVPQIIKLLQMQNAQIESLNERVQLLESR